MGAAYCQTTDLLIPAALLSTIPSGDVTAAIEEGSRVCDSYLVVRYELPLQPLSVGPPALYPADLVEAAAAIATYRMLRRRGFNPDGKQSELIRSAYDDAKQWLRDIGDGKAGLLASDAQGYGDTTTSGGPIVARVLQAYPGEALEGTLSSTFFNNPVSEQQDEEATQVVGAPMRRGW